MFFFDYKKNHMKNHLYEKKAPHMFYEIVKRKN